MTTPITTATAQRLRNELNQIVEHDLPAAQSEVVRAQAAGDIAENPDVRLALDEVARLEARRRQVADTLRDAPVLDAESSDRVGPGLVVTLGFEEGEETYLFGASEDRHPDYDVLSARSPIGQSIEGLRVGDHADVSLPVGTMRVEVRAIALPTA